MATSQARAAARERLRQKLEAQLDRLLPPDDAAPLEGQSFRDFEEQAEQLKAALLPAFLEERFQLDPRANPPTPGTCPHCGSPRTRWREDSPQPDPRLSTVGAVTLTHRPARCSACERSFFPSGA